MSHEVRVKEIWEEGLPLLKEFLSVGAQQFFRSLPNRKEVFILKDRCIRCIDEGTTDGIHLAGSGILLDIDQAVEILKKAGADGLYSHDECGAAKLYANQEGLDPGNADECCREWIKSLCEKSGLPYKGHISIADMARPSGFHNAQVIYCDATGSFNNAAQDIPAGFVISRKFLEPDYAKKELEVAINIALGDHGFGALFTRDLPLCVIVVVDTKAKAEEITNEICPVVEKHKGRVKLDVLVS